MLISLRLKKPPQAEIVPEVKTFHVEVGPEAEDRRSRNMEVDNE